MPIHKMDPTMRTASSAMVARWGFEAMLFAEKGGGAFEVPQTTLRSAKVARKRARQAGIEEQLKHPSQSRPLPYFFGSSKTHQAVDLGVLGAFNITFLLGVLTVLVIRDPDHG